MRHLLSILFFLLLALRVPAQSPSIDDSINRDFIYNTLSFLADDKLKGRVNYSKEQLIAAEFSNNEFKSYGLTPYIEGSDFFIPFRTLMGKRHDEEILSWNDRILEKSSYQFFPSGLVTSAKRLNDFTVHEIAPPFNDSILFHHWAVKDRNLLLWVKAVSGSVLADSIKKIPVPDGVPGSNILLVAAPDLPVSMFVSGNKEYLSTVLFNVVGVLPGRSLQHEAILFSAHYDHVSTGLMGELGDIYNGANDNASGTTAVLSLAKYFAMRNDNERTLIFCLFAGEELGLLGSRAFVEYVVPENIKAMINVEMIGMTNATGKNAFMVTGPEYSNLTGIISQNLKGEKIKVSGLYNDDKLLFKRSDNYPFAEKGVPAHTIMCSNDNERCYHKPCDEAHRIDIDNMTTIIRAIAKGCRSLISGEDTPSRIRSLD